MSTIQNIGRSNYRYYSNAVSRVGRSCEKLSTGEKLSSFGAAADISIATRIDREARANATLLPTIQDGMGMVNLQENLTSQFSDILSRLYELAASTQDNEKSPFDMNALGQEYSSLVTALGNIAGNAKWESLTPIEATAINQAMAIDSSGNAITQNIAMAITYGATDLVAALQAYSCTDSISGALSLANLNGTGTVATSAGVVLSNMIAQVGANMRVLENAYSNQETSIQARGNTQEAIRGIDPVLEVAAFTAESVRLNTAQIIQTQANDLISSLNRFLQSM